MNRSNCAGIRPEFSVVIPVFNGMGTIGETLESFVDQRIDVPWEVVVADNGSTDGTRDLVRSLVSGFPVPLRLVDASARRGAAYARNLGVLAAEGDAIGFCDSDDRVGVGWIAAALQGLVGADAVGGPLRELRTPHRADSPIIRSSVEMSQVTGEPMVIGTGNLVIRRDVFMEIGGFDMSMQGYGGEDNEFALRLREAGVEPAVSDELVLYFRRATRVRTMLRKVWSAARAEALIWHKHPNIFPAENRRTWYLLVAVEFPRVVVGECRRRNFCGAARFAVRRAGNVYERLFGVKAVAPAELIQSMQAPLEITRSDV